jgi:hypothetical protein
MKGVIWQRILVCDECGRTPEDFEPLWEMCGLYICADCIEKPDDEKKTDW